MTCLWGLAHFVFCQYTFFGQEGHTVVAPYINPDVDPALGMGREANKGIMKFNHTKVLIFQWLIG